MSAIAPVPVRPPARLWTLLTPGLLLIVALLLLFRDTAAAMVDIWMRSETFTHCFLVPPISLWLVWRRRARLALLPVRPVPWLLVGLLAFCALWLLGEMASVNAATQVALVSLIVMSVPAVYGWPVARELTFPLLFLFFAVPFGDFLVPVMMEHTADFTVLALQASGLPVYREGLQFVIPSGSWSVVEACSGVRYLIASFMVGTLFAYLNYNSPRKRLVFMGVSLLVPVLANWLRAYLIVMLGHLSNNEIAAGVDHIIYGWVFFGIVIGMMFMVGARWTDPESGLPPPWVPAWSDAAPARLWGMAAAGVVLLLATQVLMWHLGQPSGTTARLALPAAVQGWTASPPESGADRWTPNFATANVVAEGAFNAAGAGGGRVQAWVGFYRDQNYGRKLVTSTNGLVDPSGTGAWSQVSSGVIAAPGPGRQPKVWRTAVLRGANDPAVLQAPRLRVWQAYWVDGALQTSDARVKLRLALNRLLGRGDDGAVILLSTSMSSDGQTTEADALLTRYVQDHLPALDSALQAARHSR
jgi:exosortase A